MIPKIDGWYWLRNEVNGDVPIEHRFIWRVVHVFNTAHRNRHGERVCRDGQSLYYEDNLKEWQGVKFVGPIEPPRE